MHEAKALRSDQRMPPERFSHLASIVATSMPELLEFRHDLHAHPETAFQEHRTAQRISEHLTRHGIAFTRIAGTGIVADLEGTGDGPVVGVRSDIDALPIGENTGLPFASTVPNAGHLCGHDLHTTALLGVAVVLNRLGDQFTGAVRLIFQPAEETLEGARALIAAGVLEQRRLKCIFGYHVSPELEPGLIGFWHGNSMASKDDFRIEVVGTSSHEAHPHTSVDCVNAASLLTLQIGGIGARLVAPNRPVVCRVTSLVAPPVQNSTPERAVLTGCIRAMDDGVRQTCITAIGALAKSLESSHGVKCLLTMDELAPVLVNDLGTLAAARADIEAALGSRSVVDMPGPSMGSEDFAFFSRLVPAAHFRIGVHGGQGHRPLHAPDFIARDEAIAPAIIAITAAVLGQLQFEVS